MWTVPDTENFRIINSKTDLHFRIFTPKVFLNNFDKEIQFNLSCR